MTCEGIFEAVSHPLRVEILKRLSEKPIGFSELKRELGIKSSGKLDFHLKKLEGLIAINEDGKYCLTRDGYAALQAIEMAARYGWQKRAYYLNVAVCVFINGYCALTQPWNRLWLMVVLPITVAWLAFYTYWTVKKRRALRW
ncbi:MAG: hypothetical protein B6U94_02900 [Thermofilum sp. ex4484_79]|nr:MAG: hypothetical protein B6U94_02900 [Thermofilum sp. ex4484_79]